MKAKIKFNGGKGALLCNGCDVILELGTDHDKNKEHFCFKCGLENSIWKGVELEKYKTENGSFNIF